MDFAETEFEKMSRLSASLRHPVIGLLTSNVTWEVPLNEEDITYLDN
jgi:hypothetical protein